LDQLQHELAHLGVAVLLSNRSGRIVARRVDSSRQRDRLDDSYAAEGFNYSEETVGTNGLGTSLEEKQAVFVQGAEHFNDVLHGFACTGVPIPSPRGGTVAGSLSLASAADSSNEMMLSLTKLAAHQISQALRDIVFARERVLAAAYARRCGVNSGPSMLLTGDSVLSDTALLPLLNPTDHVALWELVCQHKWTDSPAYFEVSLAGSPVVVEVHRMDDSDGSAYLLEFPPEARKQPANRVVSSRATSSTAEVHPDPDISMRVLAAAVKAEVVALSGKPGSGRLHTSSRVALANNKETLTLDATAFGLGAQCDWATRADAAVRDGQYVVIRHFERLPDEAFPVIDALARAGGGGHGMTIANVDRTRAPGEVLALLDRLAVTIELPDLSDMRGSIATIASSVLESITAASTGLRLSSAALQCLARWSWPGNVAELRTALIAAASCAHGTVIQVDDLPARITDAYRSGGLTVMQRAERRAIVQALDKFDGNRSRAAEELGIGRTTLYRKLNELKIGAASSTLA
jgi:hypothetical protein